VSGQWPSAPDRAAYHGLAGEIVSTIEPHTEADPVALLVQLLGGFGNLVGRNAHFAVEATRHHPNLFATLVGRTSRARKGTSWGHINRLLAAVDSEWAEERIVSGLSSGEGLIHQVRDGDGPADKRLLVYEAELAGALKTTGREGNTLSPVVRDAWDTGSLSTLTKNSATRARDAHISIIGHITGEELRRYLTATEMANGFGNRFLWICVTRARLLPDGGAMHTVDVATLVRRLTEALRDARSAGELRRDQTASALWREEMYPELTQDRLGLLGAVTARAEAQVVRLALIYALLDRATAVRVDHLRAARALWDYADRSARYIFGEALGNADADKILRELRAASDGLTRTEISSRLFHKNKPKDEIDSALDVLLESGLVRHEDEATGGRPTQRWRATNETKKGVESPPSEPLSSFPPYGKLPSPADAGYLDFVAARYRAGHLTTAEALELEQLAGLTRRERAA
jgi:hypothetical protein